MAGQASHADLRLQLADDGGRRRADLGSSEEDSRVVTRWPGLRAAKELKSNCRHVLRLRSGRGEMLMELVSVEACLILSGAHKGVVEGSGPRLDGAVPSQVLFRRDDLRHKGLAGKVLADSVGELEPGGFEAWRSSRQSRRIRFIHPI